jgi:hypothetical protein
MWHHPEASLKQQAASTKQEGDQATMHTSIKRSSDKRLSKKAMKIHEAWCIENGYLKPQATSVKLPESRYKSSDYSKRATNCRSDDMTQESWR